MKHSKKYLSFVLLLSLAAGISTSCSKRKNEAPDKNAKKRDELQSPAATKAGDDQIVLTSTDKKTSNADSEALLKVESALSQEATSNESYKNMFLAGLTTEKAIWDSRYQSKATILNFQNYGEGTQENYLVFSTAMPASDSLWSYQEEISNKQAWLRESFYKCEDVSLSENEIAQLAIIGLKPSDSKAQLQNADVMLSVIPSETFLFMSQTEWTDNILTTTYPSDEFALPSKLVYANDHAERVTYSLNSALARVERHLENDTYGLMCVLKLEKE